MSLREKINRNPVVALGVVTIVLAAAGWYCYTVLTDRGGQADAPRFYYYTVDEGKTLFSVAADEIPPIMKDGKEAVRARVFSCDNLKTTFVAYLDKYTDDYKKSAEAERAKPKDPKAKGATIDAGDAFARRVKKPGDPAWVPLTSQQGQIVIGVSCPSQRVADLVEKLP